MPDVVEELQQVAAARDRARRVLTHGISREQAGLDALRSRPAMADPRHLLEVRRDEVTALRDRARVTLRHRLDRAGDDVEHRRARAEALSPLATLRRGYAVLQGADGAVVTSLAQTAPGAEVTVRVADGRLHATTTRLEPLADPTHPTEPAEDDDA
ncbi:exodeoxyribonuclease VII large subunit [Nocardioides zeae]